MSPRPGENWMDALLRSFLRRRGAAAETLRETASCPDTELVAAYFEHALGSQERSRLESHFACCERCQRMLAAMVRAELTQSPGKEVLRVRSFPFNRLVRWLVPAAAAAAALLLWVVLRPAPVPQLPAAGRPTTPAPLMAENRSAENAANRKKEFSADDQPLRSEPASRSASQFAVFPAPPAKDEGRLGVQHPEQKAGAENRIERHEVPLTAAPPAQSLLEMRIGESPAETGAKQTRSALSASAAPAYVSGRAQEEPGQRGQRPESSPLTAQAPQLLVHSRESEQAPLHVTEMLEARVRRRASEPGIAISPDPRKRWRMGREGKIEFSPDGGASWVMQSSGVAADLLAADAPTASTCWAVGRTGIVLRTTDGKNWERLKQPTDADLVGVFAQDKLTAVVFAADGQAFMTQDGGQSWRSVALRTPVLLPHSPEPNHNR